MEGRKKERKDGRKKKRKEERKRTTKDTSSSCCYLTLDFNSAAFDRLWEHLLVTTSALFK